MIRIIKDLKKCARLWALLPNYGQGLFDLWEVRQFFQEAYGNLPFFICVHDTQGDLKGILPLSLLPGGKKVFFPGEIWQGKTWLENNRVLALTKEVMDELLSACEDPIHLRYIDPDTIPDDWDELKEDEIRYLFYPWDYEFKYQSYLNDLPHKRLKRIQREINELTTGCTMTVRRDQWEDLKELFRLNLDAFGDDSYFADDRFFRGFENLLTWLWDHKLLRITTIKLGGRTAAVDVGAVWNNVYTMLAGGTDPEFPGVAKLINFLHIETACQEHYDCLDFLCGDFGWKKRFNLIPRRLYKIDHVPPTGLTNPQPTLVANDG